MQMSARVGHADAAHDAEVRHGDASGALAIPPRSARPATSVNDGDVLMRALELFDRSDRDREAAWLDVALDGLDPDRQ